MSENWKTVRLSDKTYKALAKQGDLSETFDSVITKLMHKLEEKK